MATPALALSTQFGPYRIIKELGSGGMGSVYLVADKVGRQFALKVPRFDKNEEKAVIDRFYREARVAATLDHPNLCPVLDVDQIDGIHFLLMPFLDGQPLAQLIHRDRPWDAPRATALVAQLARALQSLHDKGLVHRDLKPGNIMIRPSGEPVILDFGLARSFTSESQRLTATGAVMGTPSYMPPEQVVGAKDIGPAADIYALGVIFYQLVTGTVPFEGSVELVFARILHAPLEPPSARRSGLDAAFDHICQKALAKKPEERYPNAGAFAAELDRFASGGGKSAVVPPTRKPDETERSFEDTIAPESVKESTVKDSRASEILVPLLALGVLLLSLVGVGTLLYGPTDGEGDQGGIVENKNDRQGKPVERPKETVPPQVSEDDKKPLNGSTPPPKERVLEQEEKNSIGMKFVLIPKGKYLRGSPLAENQRETDEGPQHEVEITKPFYLGIYEVTQEEYRTLVSDHTSYFSAAGVGKDEVQGKETKRFPVESVSWEEAKAFCDKLSARPAEKAAGWKYRLPTEAEWEYACRGGTKHQVFHFGNSLSKEANFNGTLPYGETKNGKYLACPTPVGQYKANDFGLFDMHGNVWEWCEDWHNSEYYNNHPKNTETPWQDPQGPKDGTDRVLRGGSWFCDGHLCRSARRGHIAPEERNNLIGFRVVCVPTVRTP